jgi:hypothetical protein
MLNNKLGILLTGGFLSSTLGFLSLFSQPAWAINRVSDSQCKSRTDFFKLWNNTTIAKGVCFANAGSLNVHIYNVYQITNGNNYGYVKDSNGYTYYFCKKNWRLTSSPSIRDVVYVSLSASPPSICSRSSQLAPGQYRYGS